MTDTIQDDVEAVKEALQPVLNQQALAVVKGERYATFHDDLARTAMAALSPRLSAVKARIEALEGCLRDLRSAVLGDWEGKPCEPMDRARDLLETPMADPIQDDVEALAALLYEAEHAGYSNCYAWDDTWEEYQEATRPRYYKMARTLSPRLSAAKEEGIREGMERCIQHFEAKAKGFREAAAVQKRRVGPLASGYECAAKEIAAIRKEVSNG